MNPSPGNWGTRIDHGKCGAMRRRNISDDAPCVYSCRLDVSYGVHCHFLFATTIRRGELDVISSFSKKSNTFLQQFLRFLQINCPRNHRQRRFNPTGRAAHGPECPASREQLHPRGGREHFIFSFPSSLRGLIA